MSKLSPDDLIYLCSDLSDILDSDCNLLHTDYNLGHDLELHFRVKDRKGSASMEDLAAMMAEYIFLMADIRGYSDLINYHITLTPDSENVMIFLRYLDRNNEV